MEKQFEGIQNNISNNDSDGLESFFSKPGGRKYLENLLLILINAQSHTYGEKKRLYKGLVEGLDLMEQRIRQKHGQEILTGVFKDDRPAGDID